jgi:chaperonin GroEL
LSVLGSAKTVIISKDDIIMMGVAGGEAEVKERVDAIQASMENASSSYDKDKLSERMGRLTGGVAIIKVGGASEVEVGELKDRIEDALCATRAAAEEGVVVGGGAALLYASKRLDNIKGANFDQNVGIDIIRKACKIPTKTICANAGFEGSVVADKLLEQTDFERGFNAATGEYVNMIETGIIDPVKVVRTALIDAAGVASSMITVEAMIVESVENAGGKDGMM